MQNSNPFIRESTVVDLFCGGEFHNDFLQCRVRDWYWIGRGTISMPTWHDGKLLRYQNLIAVTDAASGVFLYFDKLPHGSPSAAHLVQAIATAIETHGRPRKGVVVLPSAWASFRRICTTQLVRFVDLPGFVECGTDSTKRPLRRASRWSAGFGRTILCARSLHMSHAATRRSARWKRARSSSRSTPIEPTPGMRAPVALASRGRHRRLPLRGTSPAGQDGEQARARRSPASAHYHRNAELTGVCHDDGGGDFIATVFPIKTPWDRFQDLSRFGQFFSGFR